MEGLNGHFCHGFYPQVRPKSHYLLVNPEYHNQMIGRTLINKIKDKYQDYLRIAVIAYDNEMHFLTDLQIL